MPHVSMHDNASTPPFISVVMPDHRQDWMMFTLTIGMLYVSMSEAELDTLIYEATSARAELAEEREAALLAVERAELAEVAQ